MLFIFILAYIFYAYILIEYFIIFWAIILINFIQIMIFTTCERKVLALIQRRVGPRVIGIQGRLQYIADSIKLLTKIFVGPRHISAGMFQGAAFGSFWISWFSYGNIIYGPGIDIMEIEYNIFVIICISLGFSFVWLLGGWAAVSKYSLLGCVRAAVQIIAFELLFSLILLFVFLIFNSFNYEIYVDSQLYLPCFFFVPVVGIILFLVFLVETNRPPFDLSEAESDIVAGYNVEYSGILFGLFYLSEYINLLTACTILVIMFGGGWNNILLYISVFKNHIIYLLNLVF